MLIDNCDPDALDIVIRKLDCPESLIALHEGLITLADFYVQGAFAPNTTFERDWNDNYSFLIENNCRLLRIYEEFIKENWQSLGAKDMQTFRHAFYQSSSSDQQVVFYLKMPLHDVNKVTEKIKNLGWKWTRIIPDLDDSQYIDLVRTVWKSPEKLHEKYIQFEKSIKEEDANPTYDSRKLK